MLFVRLRPPAVHIVLRVRALDTRTRALTGARTHTRRRTHRRTHTFVWRDERNAPRARVRLSVRLCAGRARSIGSVCLLVRQHESENWRAARPGAARERTRRRSSRRRRRRLAHIRRRRQTRIFLDRRRRPLAKVHP